MNEKPPSIVPLFEVTIDGERDYVPLDQAIRYRKLGNPAIKIGGVALQPPEGHERPITDEELAQILGIFDT